MEKTVHIIGAGISGLTAAVDWAKARLSGPCARGDATGRRPLPLLFRRRDRSDYRQRQSSAAVGQPSRACYADRSARAAGRARSARIFRSWIAASGQRCCLISARAACPCGCSMRGAPCRTRSVLDYLGADAADVGGAGNSLKRRSPAKARCTSAGAAAADRGPQSRSASGLRRPGRGDRARDLARRAACRPLIARDGLSAGPIQPAIQLHQEKGASKCSA